jgi:uncharacterized membrane protein
MKAQTVPSRRKVNWRKIGWGAMTFLAALVFLGAGRYLTLDPDVYFPEQKVVYMLHTTGLLMHIVGAMLAVMIGPFQFLPKSRSRRFLNVHRWLGRTYLVAVLVGGLGGLYMAPLSYGGLPTHLGFASLGVLWLSSGWKAYRHIRRKEIEPHREWMMRNYALTFAGVMLRVWMPLLTTIGFEFLPSYLVVAWLCWVPNLLVAEWMIRRRRARRVRTTVVMSSEVASRETI